MERRTPDSDCAGDQPGPDHVPKIERQTCGGGFSAGHAALPRSRTLPLAYRFGLNRTCPPPVVISLTLGGELG